MKLRNKKTGGIWDIPKMRHPTMQEDDISFFAYGGDGGHLFSYHSLAELNEEWEDAPSTVWYIAHDGSIMSADIGNSWEGEKNIGNYFKTKEEAEKAVEKLKAWKTLRENKVHFSLATLSDENTITIFARKKGAIHEYDKELFLLFGGEE